MARKKTPVDIWLDQFADVEDAERLVAHLMLESAIEGDVRAQTTLLAAIAPQRWNPKSIRTPQSATELPADDILPPGKFRIIAQG